MIKPLIGRAGMKIRAGDGFEELGHAEMLSTPLFYRATPGDKIKLLDEKYKFNIATYRPEVEAKWIYTYDYAPDQSWTIYNNDLSGDSYRQDEYLFNSQVYFRICIRKINGDSFNSNEDINKILSFETEPSQRESKQWIDNEVLHIVEKINQLRDKNDRVFILLTDTHYTVNGTWEDTFSAVNQLSREIEPDGIIHLGDMTDGMVTKDATVHYVNKVMSDLRNTGIPVWVTLGNHDVNYFRKNPEPLSTEEQRKLYFNGGDTRYYVDLPGLRLIFLDSFDPREELRYGYTDECTKWFNNTLETTPDSSKAIIISHLPPIARLQFWTKAIRGEKEIAETLKRNTKKFIAWINGHNHADRLDNDEGYPIVSIVNAKCEAFTERKTEGFVTPKRDLNATTQEAFDIMIVNAENETIRFIRFGAGNDRLIENGRAEWV